ncbi:MAG: hypothetical protein Q8P18_32220 [Pseudomonadota bacterium]|nr:hypothetical protein [Pseudomonadota bacterium]
MFLSFLLLPLGAWLSTALHELAHLVAFRVVGGRVLAVGTGWPPIRARWRVGGTLLFFGSTAPLTGMTIPGDHTLSRAQNAFVSAAGPTTTLAIACLLLVWPTDASPIVRYLLAAWNVLSFLENVMPGHHETGGNDGEHIAKHLSQAGWLQTSTASDVAEVELYEALELREQARALQVRLGITLAHQGLPLAAGGHLAALETDVGDDAAWADRLALVRGWIAYTEDRWADAETTLRAVLDADAAWVRASARMGIAGARLEVGDPDVPCFPDAPEEERGRLTGIADLFHGCRTDDVARARRGAAAIGALSWSGELALARLYLRTGDVASARTSVFAAADGARRMIMRLPVGSRAEAFGLLDPLHAAIEELSHAVGDPRLPDRLLGPARVDDVGIPLSLAAVALCVVSVLAGALRTSEDWRAWWAVESTAAPVLGILGCFVVMRYGLQDGPLAVRGYVVSVVTVAVLLAAWILAGIDARG